MYKRIDDYSLLFSRLREDRKNYNGRWVKTFYESGVQMSTHSHQTWRHIKARCLKGSEYQKKKPTYLECEVGEDFQDFEIFTNWYVQQEGYRHLDYQLDKDILVDGNKIYTAENCCLVPKQLNIFFCRNSSSEICQGIGKVKTRSYHFVALG